MLTQSFLVPLLASLGVAAIASSANTTSAAPVVVGAYIIELEDDQGASEFLQDITDDARVRTRLNAGVFNGVSIQFRNLTGTEDRAATVALLPGVKNIWPVREYSLPDYTTHWRGTPGIALLSRRQDSRDELAPHVMTQVDLLRGEGVTGKGVKIAVIDTGIDYLHPALGGCLGPDCLVSNGWDFVGDDFGGATSTPIPGPDPMDCAGHGTHVAGIIAAQENDLGFTGAAPGVKLGAYKVFSCTGNTSNDILIAAFLKAYSDGSDIITASLGADSGWSGDPYASLDFSESSITVPAGGSADISVTVTPPQGVDDSIVDRLPIYPGYITLNGTNGDGLSLPYQGATQAPDSTIILPKAGTATPDMLTLPLINYYLVFGSRLLRADVSPVVSNSSADSRHGSTILGTWSLGNAAGFPIRYGPNLVALIPWDGQLEDGTYTPAGTYNIVIKALKIFGNETNQDDYQAISSQPFSIVYAE